MNRVGVKIFTVKLRWAECGNNRIVLQEMKMSGVAKKHVMLVQKMYAESETMVSCLVDRSV